MKKISTFLTVFVLIMISFSIAEGQENSADRIKLSELVVEFEQSIIEKDSTRFKKIFFSEKVPFTGIMSEKTEMSIKKDYPDFEGIAVSNAHRFIVDICKSEKKQVEKFYNIDIATDGIISAISFDYSYNSGTKMIQWGNEKWNLVKVGKKWLITDVVYSIHFPDIEPFPYQE